MHNYLCFPNQHYFIDFMKNRALYVVYLCAKFKSYPRGKGKLKKIFNKVFVVLYNYYPFSDYGYIKVNF